MLYGSDSATSSTVNRTTSLYNFQYALGTRITSTLTLQQRYIGLYFRILDFSTVKSSRLLTPCFFNVSIIPKGLKFERILPFCLSKVLLTFFGRGQKFVTCLFLRSPILLRNRETRFHHHIPKNCRVGSWKLMKKKQACHFRTICAGY